ncbi:hypothetical protein [Desulfobaculum bizertense]|uniref:Alginate export domain-containing protein n=1 Tax=Desulfobaculum bizertense DSM 18034 TaxID=1121442 RepID=A0A1T4WAT0_9BACT|nr:hypothetical protein [Desulfobaculum bizertense]SKA73801.1 hypothetical protein SAMN02745702_01920 [Desulfobaculum bizertense DSM 18034]
MFSLPISPLFRLIRVFFCALSLGLFLFPAPYATAQEDSPGSSPLSSIDMEWSGHIKLYGRALFPQEGTAFDSLDSVGLGTNYDGLLEARVNNKTFFGDHVYSIIHWEAGLTGGGSREDGERLKDAYPALFPNGLLSPPNDDRRLVDLTAIVHEDDGTVLYHRLDRAFLAFQPDWGEIRVGRQAVTWGHGFTFNPMDLFNPFSPTDLERDYKLGDDIALVQVPVSENALDLIYVARRNPDTSEPDFDSSSLGGKFSIPIDSTNLDIILTRHYEDYIAGVGAVGYVGNAAWRFDVTGTFLDTPSRGRSAYLSAVANLDYSWNWFGKNWYGYTELYYNGLSDNDYTDPFTDPAIADRIARGELFALGSMYWSGNINIELHPLLNVYLTAIVNLDDPSGVWLPRIVYDVSDNIQLTATAGLNWGASNTEYGGFPIPGLPFSQKPADYVTSWVTWYF